MDIYVYAGYYELFVTSKKLNSPFLLQGFFKTVKEAETFIAHNFDVDDNIYYERSLYSQSEYAETLSFLSDVETERYKIDITDDGDVLQCTKEWQEKNLTLLYKNVPEGDWVRCNNCGKMMLLPYGTEICPECGFEGGLAWVDDEKQEMWEDEIPNTIQTLRKIGSCQS